MKTLWKKHNQGCINICRYYQGVGSCAFLPVDRRNFDRVCWSQRKFSSTVHRCSMFINICLTFITAPMIIRGEKLGGGSVDRSTGMLGIVIWAIFLKSSRICPTLLSQHGRLSHKRIAHRKCTSDIRGLTRETYVSCVLDFSCTMYIDLNHCDSRIWVTACLVALST
jgi:hypothetical protein